MDFFSLLNPGSPDDLFSKSRKGGRARPVPKPIPAEEAEPEPAPAAPPPEEKPKDKPKVVLSNLKWSKPGGIFNDKITLILDAEVPAELKNITRVELSLVAKLKDDTLETVVKTEVHLKAGKASKEVTLFYPQFRDHGGDGKLLEECDYVFIAKHRDSEAVESSRLPVKKFAVKLRFGKEEGWIGVPVKILADTPLPDGAEIGLKVTAEGKAVVQAKLKAAGGKLEYAWTPCMCGLKAGKDNKVPESLIMQAELTYLKEKAQSAKPYKLKGVNQTDWETFSKDFSWNGFKVHSEYRQKVEGLFCKVLVKEKVLKAWGGYWINMGRAGITGKAGGNPWDGYRWGRVEGAGMVPNRYHDGTGWKKMPTGFVPADGEYSAVGFVKSGDKFVQAGTAHEWPEKFKDYEYDKYKSKRASWIKDSHTRWSQKFKLRPKTCTKGESESGCGYDLDLTLELEKVDAAGAHAISLCPGAWRSNAAIFFYGESRVAVAAHEVGHLVGLPDEYAGGATDTSQPDGDGLVSGIDADSLMGADLTKVKKRHYATFSQMAKTLWKSKSSQDLDFPAGKK